ncbi:glycosyltransferase family 39 protein [bacterium]|nr:glycosyltransferase family 39 protein [bacterium]
MWDSLLADRRRFAAVAGLLLLLIAGFQFGFLSHRSLWNDEFITLRVIGQTPREVIAERLASNHVPGYFLGLQAWSHLAGTSETALRFPSAVFAFLGILVVWRLGAYLFGERLGLLVLALAGFNQFVLQMGTNVRMYSGLYFTVACSLSALIRYLDTGKKRYAVYLALAGILGIALHLLHVFAIGAGAIYVAARWKTFRDRLIGAAAGLIAPLIIWTPLIVGWEKEQTKVGIMEWGGFKLYAALRQAAKLSLGDYGYAHTDVLDTAFVIAALSFIAIWIARIVWKRKGRLAPIDRPTTHFPLLWIWFLVPPIGITLASMTNKQDLIGPERYFISIAPAAVLLFTEAVRVLAAQNHRRLATAVGTWFVLITLAATFFYLRDPGSGLREVVQHLAEHIEDGDVVVTSRTRARSRAFEYYGLPGRPDAEAYEARDSDEAMDQWLRANAPKDGTLWIVYYGDWEDSRATEVPEETPDVYVPLDDLYIYGSTAVRPFRVQSTN